MILVLAHRFRKNECNEEIKKKRNPAEYKFEIRNAEKIELEKYL